MTSTLVIEIWGGMGDALLATPALKALKLSRPDLDLRVRCQENHFEVLEHNPHLDYVSFRADDPGFADAPALHTNYGRLYPSITSRKHASELIADLLGVTLDDRTLTVGLTEADEQKAMDIVFGYRNPITLHITSGSLHYKNWPLDRWVALVRRMPECTFIQLGEEKDPRVASAVDVRGMTTAREAIAVVKHSRCFVGVDSFLNHATRAVGTPGVVLFGPSTPTLWGHPENTNIYKAVACSPCVDTIGTDPCPHAHRCMTTISVDEVEAAISRMLEAPRPDLRAGHSEREGSADPKRELPHR